MGKLRFLLISLTCLLFNSAVKCEDSSLVLVHCLFRHGNRTVGTSTYPKDPYKHQTYFPFGYGELTNKGKLQEYRIGKYLRERYDKFLGHIWTPQVLDALSCNYDRTKMSLESVFTGLYPPAHTQMAWNNELNWQPIPYNIIDEKTNHLLVDPYHNCPNYLKAYKEFGNSPEHTAIKSRYTDIFKYLTDNTGEEVTSNSLVLKIYKDFLSQEDWGLELPSWTKTVYPDTLEKVAGEHHIIATYNDELRRLSGGFLLKKIIEDSKAKVSGELNLENRKLFLYSAHDTNVAHLLGTLKVMYPHNPPYGSFILFELHKINDEYGFKLFYQNYKEKEPIVIKIPNCEELCPFSKFESLTKDVIPQEDNPCGDEVKQ